jgi:ligand-binding sensor domain-containing protein
MGDGEPRSSSREIVERRKRDLVLHRISAELSKLLRYRHYEHSSDPNWTSYASQRHICDIAFDHHRNLTWLATWGGVLCLDSSTGTRHTSEHGLIGNATRCVVVDNDGVIWAAGQEGGICSLLPEERSPWRVHTEINSWTVLRMAPNPSGGIYAVLSNSDGEAVLHRVSRESAAKPKADVYDRSTKEISAMIVDDEGVVWTANPWGLDRHQDNHGTKHFEQERTQILALATGIGGGLWVGTNRGLYRFREDAAQKFQEQGPRDEIVCLAHDGDSGVLWIATATGVGRFVNNVWQLVPGSVPDRINVLRTVNIQRPRVGALRSGEVWAGGAHGVYKVRPDGVEPVMSLHPEDALSNSVQCLLATDKTLWMGTTSGLFSHSEKGWVNHKAGESQVSDVRTLVAGEEKGKLWIGSWNKGILHCEGDVCAGDPSLELPVISMSAGADGSFWVATIDAIYHRAGMGQPWRELPSIADDRMASAVIRVICYRAPNNGKNQKPVLWVGTSVGLFRYEPKQENSWKWENDVFEKRSIQSLALDPRTNLLWVGTNRGLFSETDWKLCRDADVRALAFSPPPEHALFLGTTEQVECWTLPDNGEVFAANPTANFSVHEGGLASSLVTALAVREIDDQRRQLWVGSPAGVSSYQFSLQGNGPNP